MVLKKRMSTDFKIPWKSSPYMESSRQNLKFNLENANQRRGYLAGREYNGAENIRMKDCSTLTLLILPHKKFVFNME